jgi:hypothetical protein
MPKRGKRPAQKSMARADEVLVPFRDVKVGLLAAGVTTSYVLAPVDLGARCLQEAELWQNFCIEKLHVELKPSTGTAFTEPVAAGVYLNQTDGATTVTFANVTQQSHFVMVVPGQTVSSHCSVGQRELMATKAQKSFKTVAGGADDWDEVQGAVSVCAATGDPCPFVLVLSGVIRFSSMVSDAATPAVKVFSRRQKEVIRELVDSQARALIADSVVGLLKSSGASPGSKA